MPARHHTVLRTAALVLALTGWTALLLQLHLTLDLYAAQGRSVAAALVFYFSFFTVLTNLLAAICLSTAAIVNRLNKKIVSFLTAITAYMAMVGSIYALLLRHAWSPQGLQKLADMLLHDFLPLSVLLFWVLLVPKGMLKWRSPLPWLLYPLGYLAVTLGAGTVSGRYPYPFVDVAVLGYGRVLLNASTLTAAFLILCFVLVGIDRLMGSVR